jgi:hypothetical protein
MAQLHRLTFGPFCLDLIAGYLLQNDVVVVGRFCMPRRG